jgi:hypothetical protein
MGDMTVGDEVRRPDESRGEAAARRAQQLQELAAKLAAGRHATKPDAVSAAWYADEAHFRARQAHMAAARRHCRAAEVHDRAARVHEEAAAAGIGDVAAHLAAVKQHLAARDSDYRAADVALEKARRE